MSAMHDTPTAPTTVTTEHELPASPADVWELLTTDEGFASWSGEGASIDPTPGGPISTPDDATGVPRVGAVEEAEPTERLRYRWWPVDEPDLVSVVEVEFSAMPNGTRLVITERLALPMDATACVLTSTAPRLHPAHRRSLLHASR